MADNYLITGYHGVPHVTAENDRGINAAIFGKGRFVLPVGEKFRAEYVGNNTVRMFDGKLMDNGAAAGIPAGHYIDIRIPEAGQGKKRNDIIVFQYRRDASTLVESGSFEVVSGTETAGTPTDPALVSEDLLTDTANTDQMALWRVQVSAAVISAPERMFTVGQSIKTASGVVVDAFTENGTVYTATADGIDTLYDGMTVTIIPHVFSEPGSLFFNLNGLGEKEIVRNISGDTWAFNFGFKDMYLCPFVPVRLTFGGGYWIIHDCKTEANDIYGKVPVQHGGFSVNDETTEADKKTALINLLNLGVAPAFAAGTTDLTPGESALDTGKLYLVYE